METPPESEVTQDTRMIRIQVYTDSDMTHFRYTIEHLNSPKITDSDLLDLVPSRSLTETYTFLLKA